jgi:uncharacterized protein YgbK (DUF1537 family)
MIAVVADDFTGAAELAAVGMRYGLSAEVQTTLSSDCNADILVIDTDTRSRAPEQAAAELKEVLGRLQQIPPDWIYKKVDSVLRGHVVAELEATLTSLGGDRVILVPANPSLGRKICDGRYFVHDVPLEKTPFAYDPEHPVRSSDVLTMLGPAASLPVCLLNPEDAIWPRGIVLGQASSKAHLKLWAKRCDHLTVPAGAAEFFAALLEVRGLHEQAAEGGRDDAPPLSEKALFVCTSGSGHSRKALEQAAQVGMPIAQMPIELFQADDTTDEYLKRWADDAVDALEHHAMVIVSINQPVTRDPQLPQRLRRHTAALIESVLNLTTVHQLYLEGGATASAIVRRLRWTRFFGLSELAPGVVSMRVAQEPDCRLTVKPGSYCWPEKIPPHHLRDY